MRKSIKKQVKPKSFCFVQSWGPYESESLICLNSTNEQMISFLSKAGSKKEFMESLKRDMRHWKDRSEKGFFWKCNKTAGSIIWLKCDRPSWSLYETLLHEIHHATYFMLQIHRGMENEPEALAYMTEFLFREIREKIESKFAKKSKSKAK